MKKTEHENLVLTIYKMNKTNPTCLLPYSAEHENLLLPMKQTVTVQSISFGYHKYFIFLVF